MERYDDEYQKAFYHINVKYKYERDTLMEYANKNTGCIVLDNCFTSRICLSFCLNELSIYNNKLIIITIPFPYKLSSFIRSIFDKVFIFKDTYNIVKYYDYFGKHYFDSYEEFEYYYLQYTDHNHTCLLIDKNDKDNPISSYKALV
jgi:hypothetical protein